MSSSSSVSDAQAGTSSAVSTQGIATVQCDVCSKQTSTRCPRCGLFAYCDKNCFVKYLKEHKKTCKVLSEAQSLAREVALAELGGKQPFWTGLDDFPQQIIAGYMDVVTLCRTDSAMTS